MKKIAFIFLLASCQTVNNTDPIKKAEKITDEQIKIYWEIDKALEKKDTVLSRKLEQKSMDIDDEMDKVYYLLPDSIRVRLDNKLKMETEIMDRLKKESERMH